MRNRDFGLPGLQLKDGAAKPAEGKARVGVQAAVHQRDRCIDVFAEITERHARARQNEGIIDRVPKRSARVIHTLLAGLLRGLRPTVQMELKVAQRSHCEGRAIGRIARSCVFD